MINIVLCDANLETIKLVFESIAKIKKININIIASELGELCSCSLSPVLYYFLINTDVFPKEAVNNITSLENKTLFFYSSEILEKKHQLTELENFLNSLQEENLSRKFYNYFKEHFKSLKFDFSSPGTYYLIDFLELFYSNFNQDTSSFKYIFPYVALKRNKLPYQIYWDTIIAIEEMYVKNGYIDELSLFAKSANADFENNIEFQNIFYDLIKFIEPKNFDINMI